MHLIFNMFWLFYFGTQIETKRGAGQLGLLVLAIAIFSNVGEAIMPAEMFKPTPLPVPVADGIGFSGVGFGLFGFVWLRMVLAPSEGLFVSTIVIAIHFIYAVAGVLGFLEKMMPHVDHWAHGLGLLAGVGLAYVPELFRRK